MLIQKKSLSQVFLTKPLIIKKIIDVLSINEDETVIEIGSGLGYLTKVISKQCKKVIAIEIDSELIKLAKINIVSSNVFFINEDILKVDLLELFKKETLDCKKIKIIGNLPYSIATKIVLKILNYHDYFSKFVFMLQWEMAERFVALPNTKKYNDLTVKLNFYAETKIEFKLKPNNFIPRPLVNSAIISGKMNKNLPYLQNESNFWLFVKKMFSYKRKILLNNLKYEKKIDKDEWKKQFIDMNWSINKRAEECNWLDFMKLFRLLNK